MSSVGPILCRHLQLILMMVRRALWLMLAQGLCKAKLSNQSISTSRKNGHTSILCHSTRAFWEAGPQCWDMLMGSKLLQQGVLVPLCRALSCCPCSQQACHGGAE